MVEMEEEEDILNKVRMGKKFIDEPFANFYFSRFLLYILYETERWENKNLRKNWLTVVKLLYNISKNDEG